MSQENNNDKRVLQPADWTAPRGYANGVAAVGTQVFVAGQIGWNAQQRFETSDLAQQFVAGIVPQGVVDGFETIQVQE